WTEAVAARRVEKTRRAGPRGGPSLWVFPVAEPFRLPISYKASPRPHKGSRHELRQARSEDSPPRHPEQSRRKRRARPDGRPQRPPRRYLRALSQDQEFPLARQRPAFPRLSPAA